MVADVGRIRVALLVEKKRRRGERRTNVGGREKFTKAAERGDRGDKNGVRKEHAGSAMSKLTGGKRAKGLQKKELKGGRGGDRRGALVKKKGSEKERCMGGVDLAGAKGRKRGYSPSRK